MSDKLQETAPLDRFYSLSSLARYAALHRTTLRKRLRRKESCAGPKGALCYRLRDALAARGHNPLLLNELSTLGRAWRKLDQVVHDFTGTDDPLVPFVKECADTIRAAVQKLQVSLAYPEDLQLTSGDGGDRPRGVTRDDLASVLNRLDLSEL